VHGQNWEDIVSDEKIRLHMNGITAKDLESRYNEDAFFKPLLE
jgi:hypothetical protein